LNLNAKQKTASESVDLEIMQELQPPIYILETRIGEPVTALTDIIVSVVCFYAFYKLDKFEASKIGTYFRYYFLLLGIATLWGGLITHAFIYRLSQPWKVPGWITSTWAISLLAFAVVRHHKKIISKIYKLIVGLIVLELLMVMSVIIYTVEFKWAGVHSAFGLFLIVGSLSAYSFSKFKDDGSLWMLYGIGVFLISGVIFAAKLSINTWFNHVDLTHSLLSLAAYIMYKGISKMMNDPQQSTNLQ
jgi:hypothetical protein